MKAAMTEHVMVRKGCPLHYWAGGPEGRPLIIFTHGACVDHHSFDLNIGAVAERYRVMAWDVRGHGLSQPMGEPFSLPLAAEDLLALINELGYEKAVLIGHSNGTYISQEFVFRYPERVQALVIVDGTCITWKHTVFEDWIIRNSGSAMRLFPFETLKKTGLSYFSHDKAVQDYAYKAFSAIPKKNFLRIWKGLSTGLHYEKDYMITHPVLLMHGDDDLTGDIKKIAPLWAKRDPNCQYVVIPNARHFAVLDNPKFFNESVMAFLDKWAG